MEMLGSPGNGFSAYLRVTGAGEWKASEATLPRWLCLSILRAVSELFCRL